MEPAANLEGATHRTRRLILAEDNQATAITFAKVLRKFGHSVSIAFDGTHALQVAYAERPEIVLLDLGLPRMNGYEVAHELRTDSEMQCTWLIAVTSYDSHQDRERSKKAGFDFHWAKPVDFDRLNELLCALGERPFRPSFPGRTD